MCQTNGIHPHIKHDTSIFLVMHRIKSITHFRPLLMTAYIWGIERSGFFNGREKWAKGFENQRV